MNDYCTNITLALNKFEEIMKLDLGDEDDDHELFNAMEDFHNLLKDRSHSRYCHEDIY